MVFPPSTRPADHGLCVGKNRFCEWIGSPVARWAGCRPTCGLGANPKSWKCEAMSACQGQTSFDDLISAYEKGFGNFQAERPGSRQIDHEVVFGWLLDGEIGRFGPT